MAKKSVQWRLLVAVAVEGRPPLDEAAAAVGDRGDPERRAVVVDVERRLLEVVGVRALEVGVREQLLPDVGAVREREAADRADLVAGLAVLDLALRRRARCARSRGR